jgi:pSer/pThr/pTyr-binding forkhead associated (FHA) protein
MKIPEIKIELIHIDGPFKGEINEFFSSVVTLGRHPDCDVVFPEEIRSISRRHAEIRRDGNRFLLKDTSSNGTFVNGKQNSEVFLKSGDVLILGIGGPKISFLSTILENGAGQDFHNRKNEPQPALNSSNHRPSPVPVRPEIEASQLDKLSLPQAVQAQPSEPSRKIIEKPLIVQYGLVIKAFKKLPVTLGCGADCDFVLEGALILQHHAQIFFDDDRYWIKDLTGRNLLSIDFQAIGNQSPLQANCHLSLSPEGPRFQFLGDGRLMEVEATKPAVAEPQVFAAQQGVHGGQGPADATGANRKKVLLLLCGSALCIGLALIAYMALSDKGTFNFSFINSAMEKVVQFINHLLGKT